MHNSVFLKVLLTLLALAALAVIVSHIADSYKSFPKGVEETEYDVTPPTIEQTQVATEEVSA